MRKILGLLALMLGLLVAVAASSAHFAYFEASRDVSIRVVADDHELIDLTPIQNYSYINPLNGELVIKINTENPNYPEGKGKGVSPDSIYVFEEVFGVSNHLWENTSICVTVTFNPDGNTPIDAIQYFTEDYEGTAYGTLRFTLKPGEVMPIGMVVNSNGLTNGTAIGGNLHITAINGPCPDLG